MPKLPDLIAGMIRRNTPIENHIKTYGLYVKREDLSCVPPGPPFSKARGVYAHLLKRPEKLIGVLDTSHSQGGWAVARACQILGKQCEVYYPEFKHAPGHKQPQEEAKKLGATLVGLPAGRSAILYHRMKKTILSNGGYPVPNALKLEESVSETAKEVSNDNYDWVIIPSSSATIAAGVIKGFLHNRLVQQPRFIIHLGYSRSAEEVVRYVKEMSGSATVPIIIDEKYAYKDKARAGETPPWPCNQYYDLKAFRWWLNNHKEYSGKVLFWNIG